MSYDNLSTDRRMALWHEAGHAVAAMSMGLKIKSLGLYPMPHCLVDHKGASKEEIGIMLCAGAMMTSHIYNYEWGSHTDYEMAESLGDLNEYREKALALVTKHCAEARAIVDMLAEGTSFGREELVNRRGMLYTRDDHCLYYAEKPCGIIEEGTPEYAVLAEMVENTSPSKTLIKLIRWMAGLNTRYPAFMAKMNTWSAKLGLGSE